MHAGIWFAQVKEFGWLTGEWKLNNREVYEHWKPASDGKAMEGISYRINGGDTIVTEQIQIRFEKNAFHFIPDVAGHQPEVYFKIKSFDENGFVAENAQHDFPKIIRYNLTMPNVMKA